MADYYTARAVKSTASYIQSTHKGTMGLSCTYEVVDGPNTGERFHGVRWGEEQIAECLRVCGCTNPDTFDGIDRNKVEITVDEREYNGRVTRDVSWVQEVGAGAAGRYGERIDGAEKKAFATKLRALMGSHGGLSTQGDDVKF